VNPRVKLLAAFLFSVTAALLVLETRAQAGLPDCYDCWYDLANCRFRCDEEAAYCDAQAQEAYTLCISGGTPEETCLANYNSMVWVCSSRSQDCYNRCGITFNTCCDWW
jgi:hypothetical protein